MRVISTALDCDGLLANFLSGAVRVVEEVTGNQQGETMLKCDEM